MSKLSELYIKLVKAGKMTVDEVPGKYREIVRTAIEDTKEGK